tara:strand:+ start:328 stop:537 length:210 start_codon:yes stop_codon:yes gene_type:complete
MMVNILPGLMVLLSGINFLMFSIVLGLILTADKPLSAYGGRALILLKIFLAQLVFNSLFAITVYILLQR